MPPTPPPGTDSDTRVDDLRQQLRALGYLDAGVDRFVLGPAQGERKPAAIAALASLRIGLLAAALLGPSAALGIAVRLPGLVRGTRDAVIIALYLAVLFGLAAAIVAFVASTLVAWVARPALVRRARLISRGAGTVVGAGCLVYLTLWWRIANPDLAGVSLLWTAFALAIASAISLLLGHATAITTFAVLVAARGTREPQPARAPAARRLTAAAAVTAFAGAALLLVLSAPGPPADVSQPALAVVSPGVRVKVIAIDGLDPAVLDSLRAEGRTPTLTRLVASGAIQVSPEAVRDPARSWTTVATGQPVDVHGVQGLETRRVAGLQGTVSSFNEGGVARALRGATDLLRLTRPSVASGTELRAKTFWEVAADAGLRPAVVNWWATWPAVSSSGPNAPVVISDRATLRLERGGSLEGEIAPADLYERLRNDWPSIKGETATLVDGLLPVSTDTGSASVLRRAAEVDAVQLALASRLDVASLDLLAIYLPGLDIVQHTLLRSDAGTAASTLAARLEAVRSYYVYLDALIRDLAVPSPEELVFVVTQPGRVESISHGLLLTNGRGAATSGTGRARTIDVGPTILHALGIPVSRELAGAPILGAFAAEFLKQFPVREVDTYGRRASPMIEGKPLDAEMIERLRSLGYVR